jgi:hypothetical protein
VTTGSYYSGRDTTQAADQLCQVIEWNGRKATRLTNGTIELILLNAGGHFASLRFSDKDAGSSQNVLWEAPWQTLDPPFQWSQDSQRIYGLEDMGRFLASFTGHALCLDYFGFPNQDRVSHGLSLHGEAAIAHWETPECSSPGPASCRCKVNLSSADLGFERTVRLGPDETVAYVQEKVINHRSTDHLCDWVQHVTLGAPFLQAGVSSLTASARRGVTGHSYDGAPWLAPDSEFVWPHAPQVSTMGGFANLEQPFSVPGRGFIAGVQLNPDRGHEFFLAINQKAGLGVGYYFRRRDFPWMAIWEENCARQGAPWNGKTVARGMEFGTSPLPIGEQDRTKRRSTFDIPTGCIIPAHGEKQARYLMFLFRIAPHYEKVADVAVLGDTIFLYSEDGGVVLSIPANGCEKFLGNWTTTPAQTLA